MKFLVTIIFAFAAVNQLIAEEIEVPNVAARNCSYLMAFSLYILNV